MISAWLKPKSYVKNIDELDIAALVKDGYQLLLCDIDNTLVAFHEAVPTAQAENFLNRCRAAGLEVILCSNNTKKRIAPFAKAGGVSYVSFFCKPFRFHYRKLLAKRKIKSERVVCCGDQILTDILGGNRMKMHTVFFDPLHSQDSRHTLFSRFLERRILKWLHWRGEWKKGEYYGYTLQGLRSSDAEF